VVLLILAAIWAVVLIPPWIRSRRDIGSTRSMVSFQRRLSSIERAVPPVDAYSDEMYLDASSHHELDLGVGDDLAPGGYRADLMWDDEPLDGAPAHGASVAQLRPRPHRPGVGVGVGLAGPAGSAVVPNSASRASSRAALHRRRQVFFLLLLAVATSLGAAVVVNAVVVWAVHGGLGAAFVGYMWLLVRHHQRAIDRAAKVRYLMPARAPRPAVVVLHGTGR
jgi:hypothetical protein